CRLRRRWRLDRGRRLDGLVRNLRTGVRGGILSRRICAIGGEHRRVGPPPPRRGAPRAPGAPPPPPGGGRLVLAAGRALPRGRRGCWVDVFLYGYLPARSGLRSVAPRMIHGAYAAFTPAFAANERCTLLRHVDHRNARSPRGAVPIRRTTPPSGARFQGRDYP